jgi:hypothetical protein
MEGAGAGKPPYRTARSSRSERRLVGGGPTGASRPVGEGLATAPPRSQSTLSKKDFTRLAW